MLKFKTLFFLSIFFITNLSFASEIERNTRVTTQTINEITFYPESNVPATAVSMNDSKLSAEVRATVKKIPVQVGDIIKRGDVLIQLDDSSYRLSLKRAEVALKGINSRLSLAKYQLEQAKTLSKEKAITNERLEQRHSEVRTIKAERDAQKVAIEIAKQDLKRCTIKAPFKAIVIQRTAQVGELASPGSPLIRIIDASRIEVSARIQSQDIKPLEQAKHFEFITQDSTYNIQLRTITPAFDPIQRNREARFTFSNQQALSGTTGTLRWKQQQKHLPANMLTRRGGKLGVFVVNDKNKAEFIPLKDAQEGRPLAINLPSDMRVIINGRFAIQNGMSVTID